jgi:glycosyltransferase involved in cell wall biosynthesis
MSLWHAFYGRRVHAHAGFLAAVACAAASAPADLANETGNFAPIYLLPLIAAVPLFRPAAILTGGLALAALAYAPYFTRAALFAPPDEVSALRLVSRTVTAAALAGTAAVLAAAAAGPAAGRPWGRGRRLPGGGWPAARGGVPWLAGCVAAELLIAAAARAVPPAYDVSLFEVIPVIAAAAARRRTHLWAAALVALLAVRAGHAVPSRALSPEWEPVVRANLVLFRLAVVGAALLLDPWVRGGGEAGRGGRLPPDLDAARPESAVVAPPRPAAVPASRRPRRVLFVDHAARMGGGEVALLNLVACLDPRRFRPEVVLAEDGPLVGRLRAAGVPTRVLPLDRRVLDARKDSLGGAALLRVRAATAALAYAVRLAAVVRRGRYDLIHTNSLKADLLGGLAGRLAGRPVLWHVRDRVDPDYLPRPAVHAFRAACCLLADYVVANSHATMALLRPTFGDAFGERAARERMRVVHDGVPPAAFDVPPPAGRRAGGGGPVVGLLGRISPFKGQEYFVEAAAAVRGRFPAARFRVVGAALFGEAEYEARVRALVGRLGLGGCVEFTGFRSDVGAEIARLDVVAHASVTGEPFGLVIAEGMAAGRPVVATRGGGVPEIVEDGVSGLLVPPRDAAALAAAIGSLLADPAAARRMGARGRERVRAYFTTDNAARKVEQFYDAILRPPPGGGVGPTAGSALAWLLWGACFAEVALAACALR